MRWLAALFFLFICLPGFSQGDEKCGSTIQAHEERLLQDPEYREHIKNWNEKVDPLIRERRINKNPSCTNGPVLVPIAVHFDAGLVPASQESCVISVVEDQIAELNLELSGLDSDAGLINNFLSCFGTGILGEACLEFCLADQNHPSGYGLLDGDPAVTFGLLNFNVPSGNWTPVNPAWSDYVNVYVDNLPGGLLGVSNGIPGLFNGDGVLVDNCVFGTGNLSCPGVQLTGSGGCFALYDEGETLAHEIGHYFGLYHIWGDNSGCSGFQDGIPDTPNMSSSYNGYTACTNDNNCSDLPQTCGSEDMYMNFMSYASDGCMYMFTSDQSDVMNATAVAEGFTTSSGKCMDPTPVADYAPSGNVTLCNDLCIDFTDLSLNSPDTWNWSFTVIAGNISLDINNSTLQDPVVCITNGNTGTIETELVVSNAAGSDDITQFQIITVQVPPTWYADVDGDFFGDPLNWITDCGSPTGYVLNNLDCDDTDPNNFPTNIEICDGQDNDCDDLIDDDDPDVVADIWFEDNDGDGFGNELFSLESCIQPSGYVDNDADCDDMDWNNFPGNSETCDGQDNDCDGLVDDQDDDLVGTTYYADIDLDGFGDINNTITACALPSGYVLDNTDCDDIDPNNFPGNSEICDGQDNNCDGTTDEGCMFFICQDDSLDIQIITQDSFHAEDFINSNALIINGDDILFTAGSEIELNSGFEVGGGAEFVALIAGCNPVTGITIPTNPNAIGEELILNKSKRLHTQPESRGEFIVRSLLSGDILK